MLFKKLADKAVDFLIIFNNFILINLKNAAQQNYNWFWMRFVTKP